MENIYELTSVTQGTSTTESYSYDAVGNRLSSMGMSPYTYNSSNELISTPSGSYTYDRNGNMLSRPDGTQFSWNASNRLSQVTLPGSGGTVTFKYDPFGRRIQKSGLLGTTNYIYDGPNLLEEVDQSGNVLSEYSNTISIDQPLAEMRSGAASYYLRDGLGSVTSLSSQSGTLSNTYTYDTFGRLAARSGALTNPLHYTAREFDLETGIYYYRARYYDQSAGRFLSEDPIRFSGGINFYGYVRNNPTILVDPTGLKVGVSPPNPNQNTVVCDGRGGMAVQIGGPFGPDEVFCGIYDCIIEHEKNHIEYNMASNPTVCNGQIAGMRVGTSTPDERSATEIAASNAEIACLRKQLEKECTSSSCKDLINRRITQMEVYRNGFSSQ
jgi:RHS repeat-associated protein